MTEPINLYNRTLTGVNGAQGSRSASRTEKTEADLMPRPPEKAATGPRDPGEERLELSETARKTMSDPSFDRAKVEAIKAALKEGTYPLDSRRIAESFVALERLIDD